MLVMRDASFHGGLDYMDFLQRVWPLDEMPSWDRRFSTATHDIGTHMQFGDWDHSYLLTVRLDLLSQPDAVFLQFVETAVHPMVITDETEAHRTATTINRHLGSDGYQLIETGRVSGRPVFGAMPSGLLRVDPEPTSWEKVDRQVVAMRDQLMRAESEEDYQSVGLLGRELMISLAQAVIDPAEAVGEDGKVPSKSDARRMLEAYVSKNLPGRSNEALRKAIRGIVQATSAVVHDRSATKQDAALITELVSSSVHLVHILDTKAR